MFRFRLGQASLGIALAINLVYSSNSYAFHLEQLRNVVNSLEKLNFLNIKKNRDPLQDIYCSDFINSYSLTNILEIISAESNRDRLIYLLKTVPLIPISVEEKLGNSMLKNNPIILNRRDYKNLYTYFDTECNKVLESAKKLAKSEGKKLPYHFKFYIYDSLDRNAMSLPGGIILVSKGIVLDAFKLKGDKQTFLEFTLAHEIAHNTNRHYTLLLQRNLLMAYNNSQDINKLFTFFRTFVNFNNKETLPTEKLDNFASFIAQALEKLKQKDISEINRYSNIEKEADACAIKELNFELSNLSNLPEIIRSNLPQIETKISSSNSMKLESDNFISKMINIGKNYQTIISFYFSKHLDIHPSTEERYEFLKSFISQIERNK